MAREGFPGLYPGASVRPRPARQSDTRTLYFAIKSDNGISRVLFRTPTWRSDLEATPQHAVPTSPWSNSPRPPKPGKSVTPVACLSCSVNRLGTARSHRITAGQPVIAVYRQPAASLRKGSSWCHAGENVCWRCPRQALGRGDARWKHGYPSRDGRIKKQCSTFVCCVLLTCSGP